MYIILYKQIFFSAFKAVSYPNHSVVREKGDFTHGKHQYTLYAGVVAVSSISGCN